ncbi:MAG: hypothetical protein AB7U95_37400, partial [Reyranella sp.]
MSLVSRIATALACCVVASIASEGSAAQITRRLCDRPLTYDVVPPSDVPPGLELLSGVWTGTVIMAGGGEMCLAMVVKDILPDGRVLLAMAWNVSIGGREDINNVVGMGEA